MIKVNFTHDNDHIIGFKIVGHADFSEHGSDIVCSAVSALSINIINSVSQLLDINLLTTVDDKNGGYLEVEVPVLVDNVKDEKLQILINSLKIGLIDISKSYQDYIIIK